MPLPGGHSSSPGVTWSSALGHARHCSPLLLVTARAWTNAEAVAEGIASCGKAMGGKCLRGWVPVSSADRCPALEPESPSAGACAAVGTVSVRL